MTERVVFLESAIAEEESITAGLERENFVPLRASCVLLPSAAEERVPAATPAAIWVPCWLQVMLSQTLKLLPVNVLSRSIHSNFSKSVANLDIRLFVLLATHNTLTFYACFWHAAQDRMCPIIMAALAFI